MALPREKLKKKFRNGSRPNQDDFNDLIDSDINSEDDGIEFFDDGIKLIETCRADNKNDIHLPGTIWRCQPDYFGILSRK